MRKFFILMLSLIICFVAGCDQTVDVEAEKAAIRQVIEKAFKDYWDNDYEAWANSTVQGPNTHAYWASKGGYGEQLGWDVISAYHKKVIDERIERNADFSEVVHMFENFDYRIWKDAALVTFDYHWKRNKDNDPEYLPWKMFHVFEKTQDGWKYSSWANLGRNSWRDTEE